MDVITAAQHLLQYPYWRRCYLKENNIYTDTASLNGISITIANRHIIF